MAEKVKIGDAAPDFTLLDTERKPRSLREFRGRNLVLAFYPGAFISVCGREMCAFRDSLARLEELDAQVVGVSVNDPFSNGSFREANMLNFPLLCDYSREVVELYGVAMPDFAGMRGYTAAKRSVFVINKDGVVRYRWASDNPGVEPDYEEIIETLKKL
ncbi:alkyl hydroperoxide reductase [miscellaneous Crenarchaeota group-15 archaeon DG-45]|uniref:Alkyl hydroperoxide reductase n=1 Tax=miscellaneous Crenarchaeota group-15 archaeon DG-45 TaxID=1685127 RepID=A0A0M0BQX6_9ARCH|nr:MAG: alkyl hydroperoxide reductase [miscellaneous Crenarchaeota group-15 archaeon DG-45]